jgi:hypothetical protein
MNLRHIFPPLLLDFSLAASVITPVSAPDMVLEPANPVRGGGTAVSIGRSIDAWNRQWSFTPKANGLFSIRPSNSSGVVQHASICSILLGVF